VQLLVNKTAHLTSVTLLPHTNASITVELGNVVHNNSHIFVVIQPLELLSHKQNTHTKQT